MKKKMDWIIRGLMMVVLTAALPALAAPPDNFTAKMLIGGLSLPMAKMGNKSRTEAGMMPGMYTIHDAGSKKSFMINPGGKTYFEQTLDERRTPSVYDSDVVMDKKKIRVGDPGRPSLPQIGDDVLPQGKPE